MDLKREVAGVFAPNHHENMAAISKFGMYETVPNPIYDVR